MAEPHFRLRRITQAIADLSHKPWTDLRILDLGSLEGQFSLEFASKGAQVVAIEGREANNAKARAAAASRGVANVEFVTDDVRNLLRERRGRFDVVLCSGILYHLPGEDGCRLVETISDLCTHLTIIDSHVGLLDLETVLWKGKRYHGVVYREHSNTDTPAMKMASAWASLDNETSFWMTRPSLLNLLRDVGFTTVLEVFRPASFFDFSDRVTLAAIKGIPQEISIYPKAPEPDWPEHLNLPVHPSQAHYFVPPAPIWKRIGRRLKLK
jgi:SAM-dependent methyltransferase